MRKNINQSIFLFLLPVIFLTGMLNFGYTQDLDMVIEKSEITDTLTFNEFIMDSLKIYLSDDISKVEKTLRDTALIEIDGQIYKIPLKISSTAIVDKKNYQKYFKLIAIPMNNQNYIREYVDSLFRNPREKLKGNYSPQNWVDSDIYWGIFKPYQITNSDDEAKSENYGGDQYKASKEKYKSKSNYKETIFENFPIPETLDIEVDLRKSPRTVNILGIEFDYDKLDKGFLKKLWDLERKTDKKYKKIYK